MDTQKLNQLITEHHDPEAFSGVVRLSNADETLFEHAYGFANRAEKIPNRVNSRFQMASGCKIFTAVAACKLIELGTLSFETKLFDVLDSGLLRGFSREITVKQLLTHSSGITSYFEEDVNPDYEALWVDTPMYRVRRPVDFLPLFKNQTQKFSPGEKFEYNDGGFILLGYLLEQVSGKVFSDLVKEMVFEPAGMLDSGYFPTDQLPERTAYAYIQNEDGSWRTNFFAVPAVGAPDGGAYTTAPDMAKFWTALFSGSLLDPVLTAELRKPQITTGWDYPYSHYGLGIWLGVEDNGVNITFVEGADPGVALRSEYLHDSGLTLTLLGNTSHALWGLVEKIEAHL